MVGKAQAVTVWPRIEGTLIVPIHYVESDEPEPTARGAIRCTTREVSVDETTQKAKVRGAKQCPRYKSDSAPDLQRCRSGAVSIFQPFHLRATSVTAGRASTAWFVGADRWGPLGGHRWPEDDGVDGHQPLTIGLASPVGWAHGARARDRVRCVPDRRGGTRLPWSRQHFVSCRSESQARRPVPGISVHDCGLSGDPATSCRPTDSLRQ